MCDDATRWVILDCREAGPVAGLVSKDASDFCFFLDAVDDEIDEAAGARFRGLGSLASGAPAGLLLLFAVASLFLRGFLGAAVVVGADSLASLVAVFVLADDDFTPPTLCARWEGCDCESACLVRPSVGAGDAPVVGESGDLGGDESSGEEL